MKSVADLLSRIESAVAAIEELERGLWIDIEVDRCSDDLKGRLNQVLIMKGEAIRDLLTTTALDAIRKELHALRAAYSERMSVLLGTETSVHEEVSA